MRAPRVISEPNGNFIHVNDLCNLMEDVASDLLEADSSILGRTGASTLSQTAKRFREMYAG